MVVDQVRVLKDDHSWTTKTISSELQQIVLVLPDGGTVFLPQGADLLSYHQSVTDLANQITAAGKQARIEYWPSGYINP